MPIAEIELPNGKIAELEVPEGATNEQIISFAKSQFTQSQPSQPKISRAEAALETATNIPFAPRMKAGIAAAIAKPFTGEKYSDLYEEALSNKLGKLGQAREQYPIQSFATEIAANLPLGARGLAGSMGMAATQAIGESKDLRDIEDVAGKGVGAAGLTALTYGGLKAFGKGYEKLFGPKSQRMTADELHKVASSAYKDVERQGVSIKPEITNLLFNKAKQLDRQSSLGKAYAGESPILKLKTTLEPFLGKKQSLQSLQELDEELGVQIEKFMEKGRIKKEGLPLLEFQGYLRRLMDNMPKGFVNGSDEGFKTLKRARDLWSKTAKLRDVESVITRADLSDNPQTVIKNYFKNLYSSPQKLKSFNIEERKLIKSAAESGVVNDALRAMGSRLIPIGTIVAGGNFAAGAASQASSTASRSLASRAQIMKAEKLADAIITGKAPMPEKAPSILQTIIAAKLGQTPVADNQINNNGGN